MKYTTILLFILVTIITGAVGISLSINLDAEVLDESPIEIDYNSTTGILTYAGSSNADVVHVVVFGHQYTSVITASVVQGGTFSDGVYLGELEDGDYTVRITGEDYEASASFSVYHDGITIQTVDYDSKTGLLSYSGKAEVDFVNIRAYSESWSSQINACVVNGGRFSDTFYIGPLNPGVYTVEVSNNSIIVKKTFNVSGDFISIDELSFDSGNLYYRGTSSLELIHVIVYGHEYTSVINATVVESGSFSDVFELGDLRSGPYVVKFSGNGCSAEKQFIVDSSDPYVSDSVYSQDGKTLKAFNGTIDEYVLPTSVEVIADGAFDKAKIGSFVLTKDVIWDIKIKNNRYPLQEAGVQKVVIRDGVTQIPDYSFACTSITTLVIPASVKSIGIKAFYNCGLEQVSVSDSNRLQLIGTYAFGTNLDLNHIQFGSSEKGYSCSFDVGCFSNCGSLTIKLDNNFNLYSIGNGAFVNITACEINMLIGDDQDKGIHIPGTVANIGNWAFSIANISTSVVEPSKNMFRLDSFTALNIVNGKAGTVGRTITFEENSLLTSIEYCSFAFVAADIIDLSLCHKLTDIGISAFSYCLDDVIGTSQSESNLLLPSSIKSIGDNAFLCRGDWVAQYGSLITLPASLEYLNYGAFDGLCRNLTFETNSKLKYYGGSNSNLYSSIDLTNCLELEMLGSGCSNPIRLPVGVYGKGTGIVNYSSEMPIASFDNHGKILNIDKDTVGIIRGDLEQAKAIRIWGNNPHFVLRGNALYQSHSEGNGSKLLYVLNQNSIVVDDSCVSIGSGAIGPNVDTLIINSSSIQIKSTIFADAARLRNVYINAIPEVWDISVAFKGINNDVSFYVTDMMDPKDIAFLYSIGKVSVGYVIGNSILYLPEKYEEKTITYTNIECNESSLTANLYINGQVPSSIDIVALGAKASYKNGRILVDSISRNDAYLVVFEGLTYLEEEAIITFDGSGGQTTLGDTSIVIRVLLGTVLSPNSFPEFLKDSSTFNGWYDEYGTEFTGQTLVTRDITLSAKWESRLPLLYVDSDMADIYIDGDIVTKTYVEVNGSILITAIPKRGYELDRWVLGGVEHGDAKNPLELEELISDTSLTIKGRYVSSSTGLNNISNRGLPTMDQVKEIVHAYTLGGYVKTSGSMWSGMVSVPLIVDGYVYLRIADRIYKAESDTGYIVSSAESRMIPAFYHYIGYGGGYIIDYNTSKVYDLDLKQLYILDRNIESANYFNGKFYVLGKYVYSFDPNDEKPDTGSEIKTLDRIGTIDGIYGQYGVYSHELVEDVVYCITAKGDERGIAAFDLMTGRTTYKMLEGLRGMYLDDGWLSYYKGYLFLTAYSEGLFGAVATPHGDRVSYLAVNGTMFGEERYYEFAGRTFSSRFAFYDNRAFVSMGGPLYVFELPDDLTNLDLKKLKVRQTTFTSGHGNFVLDVSHINEAGSPIYIYGIPYDANSNETMWIAMDRDGELSSIALYSTENQWNSQAIRSDIDGRMLWYNDSGWMYAYTSSDKNVYYFFIEDGDSAIWYRAYGRDAADALKSLGTDIVTINAAKVIQTVNGRAVSDDLSLQMLMATYGTFNHNSQFNNIDQYHWETISNLGDSSYSMNHYFRIICGGGQAISTGDYFTYVENGEKKRYAFTDNIGDRSIIGKLLSRGSDSDTVILRFVDENNVEIPGTLSAVRKGSPVRIHLPEVINAGYMPVWKSGVNVVQDIYGRSFSSDTTFVLSWSKLPAQYHVSGKMESVADGTQWTATVSLKSGMGSIEGLSVRVTAVTSQGEVIQGEGIVSGGSVSGIIQSSDVSIMSIRIVDSHVSGNIGYVVISLEASA